MGLGDKCVDTFFDTLREMEEEEARKMGDVFSIDNEDVRRRMRELAESEIEKDLRRLGRTWENPLAESDPPAVVVPIPVSSPTTVSQEPVVTLTRYRGDSDEPAASRPVPWWRRALRFLGVR